MQNKIFKLLKSLSPYIFAIFLTIFIFTRILELGYIPSGSMEPTLIPGDLAVYSRISYKFIEPSRGDIITFTKDGELYCKRIIGVSNDFIQFKKGHVYINQKELNETAYIPKDVETFCSLSFLVPENKYFVLGDNRECSLDARYWEEPFVSRDDIVGKLIFVIPLHYVCNPFRK